MPESLSGFVASSRKSSGKREVFAADFPEFRQATSAVYDGSLKLGSTR
jgi:hypothetical protein